VLREKKSYNLNKIAKKLPSNRHEIATNLHGRFGIATTIATKIAAKIACVNGPLDWMTGIFFVL